MKLSSILLLFWVLVGTILLFIDTFHGVVWLVSGAFTETICERQIEEKKT